METTVKLNSFVKQFVAIVKGDDAEAQAQKALRQANSALSTQIAVMNGDTISLEDALESAITHEVKATVNYGEEISDRTSYVATLISAKNAVTVAQENLDAHLDTLKYLQEKQDSLGK